ncbi:MAG: BTAD domain-containing putative transcriptional regulator [bacterium]
MVCNRNSIPKGTLPRISKVIPRKRLFQSLDESRKNPIVWVSGPAGSGKTALIASYIDDRSLPCLWYEMDQGDDYIISFFYYLSVITKKAVPGKMEDLPLLEPENLPCILGFTRRYFEALFCQVPTPFIIVFDDYQQVPRDAMFHKIISAGLSRIMEGITVILVSRENPPPPLVRLRANHYMEFLGWKDLRFTIEETKDVIKLYYKGCISDEIVRELHRITQGWAAGLVLILSEVKTEGIEPELLNNHVQAEIFSYFENEIFKNMDKQTKYFLMKTAFLPRVIPRIAEKVTGITHADCMLSELNLKNHFTENLYHPDITYQYHHLFREFLLARAKDRFSEDEISYIQKQTGELMERSGYIEDAMEIYSKTGEWNKLVQLILKEAKLMVSQGKNRTLKNWLDRLPLEMIECMPWLLYWMGICLLPFNIIESRKYLEKAYNRFKSEKDPSGLFMSLSSLIVSFLMERGNFKDLNERVEELEKLLSLYPDFPSKEIEAHVTISISGALMCYEPMNPAMVEWERKANLLIQSGLDPTYRMMMGNWLVLYYLRTGEYSKAGLIIDILRPSGNLPEDSSMIMILWRIMKASHCWLTNHCSECQDSMKKGLDIAKTAGIHIWDCLLLGFGVSGALCNGNYPVAREYLKRIAAMLNNNSLYDTFQYYYLLAWEAWLKDNLSLSLEHMEKAMTLAQWIGESFILTISHIALAQILFVNGKYNRAASHLGLAQKISRETNCYPSQYKYLLTGSHFAFGRGNEEKGLKYLKKALSLGREKGFVIMDFFHPSIMAMLCSKALDARIEVEFVRELIRKLRLIPDTASLDCEQWPWPLKIFTMGRFSLEKDGIQLQFSGKAPKKPLELLKLIISFGGRDISEVQLRDTLWPDSDGDLAHRSFTTTLHRLRQLLGNEKVLCLRDGKLSVDLRYCWVDAWAFEHLLELADEAFNDENKCKAIQLIEKAVDLYKGPFLPGDTGKSWSISYRERLRYKFIHYIDKLGNYKEKTGQLSKAIECFTKGLEADDLAEDFYQHLMVCLLQLGKKSEALSVYRRCKKSLEATMEIEPSLKTQTIYKSLLSN